MTDKDSGGFDIELSAAVLKSGVEIEKFGIDFYTHLSKCVRDETGAALLRSLAGDEKYHKEMLEKELSRLAKSYNVDGVEPLEEYVGVIPDKVFMPPPNGCLTLSDTISALEKGIQVEINSIKMYDEAAEKVQEKKVRGTLQALGKWEVKHRELLEENLRLLRSEGVWYGYGPILDG